MLHNMRYGNKCEKKNLVMEHNRKTLACPYIPGGRVSLMAVSGGMPAEMAIRLRSHVYNIISIPSLQSLPNPVCGHPDMQMVVPAEGVVIHAPNMDAGAVECLQKSGFITICGEKCPAGPYPSDIPYNAAVIGKNAFLNVKYTDAKVVEWLQKVGITISHVNQGYAKCSSLLVNQEAFITSDRGIFNAAKAQNMDVLLIPPQKRISIECFEHGFIGGASGFVSDSEIAFAGAFEKLDDAGAIEAFLRKYGIKPVSLGAADVLDLGSLIPLCSV